MRNLFTDKYVTLASIALLIYFGYQSYKEDRAASKDIEEKQKYFEKRFHEDDPSREPRYNISIDPKKDYSDYTLPEKLAYKFFNKEIDDAKRYHLDRQRRMSTEPQGEVTAKPKEARGARIGDKVTYSYKISDIKEKNSSPKIVKGTVILGKNKIPKIIENTLLGMAVGEQRIMQLPVNKVEENAKENKEVLVEVTLVELGDMNVK
jgi:hypothetical protein